MTSADMRRRAIREILKEERVASQAELLGYLEQRGFQTTQPVLSRDLRSLKVAKRDGIYQLLQQERVTPLETLRSLLRGAQPAGGSIVVVRCEPGAASAVARALDAERVPGMIGTVAGDDTVFCAITSVEAGAAIVERVRALV